MSNELTRKEFIKTTALTGLGLSVVPFNILRNGYVFQGTYWDDWRKRASSALPGSEQTPASKYGHYLFVVYQRGQGEPNKEAELHLELKGAFFPDRDLGLFYLLSK